MAEKKEVVYTGDRNLFASGAKLITSVFKECLPGEHVTTFGLSNQQLEIIRLMNSPTEFYNEIPFISVSLVVNELKISNEMARLHFEHLMVIYFAYPGDEGVYGFDGTKYTKGDCGIRTNAVEQFVDWRLDYFKEQIGRSVVIDW